MRDCSQSSMIMCMLDRKNIVYNTFGALAIAAETYGLQGAVSLRVIQNVFGVVFV